MTSLSPNQIPVLVSGALGRMGSEVVKAVLSSKNCYLAAVVDIDRSKEGEDIGELLGLGSQDLFLSSDLEGSLCSISQTAGKKENAHPAVLVDFTHPSSVYENTRSAIAYGVHPVIGTTGLNSGQVIELGEFAKKAQVGAAIIPNFSVGMVLLQQAATAAASFYEFAELTELHHNKKADAPSGTCIKTAELMEELGKSFNTPQVEEKESLRNCRGGVRDSGLRIHSIRLPGIVAQQEVLLGASGETYLLRHSTIDRSAYMPGVLLTISKVIKLDGLVYGLEKLL